MGKDGYFLKFASPKVLAGGESSGGGTGASNTAASPSTTAKNNPHAANMVSSRCLQSELCHSHGQPWREPIATAWTDSLLKVTGSLKVQKSSPHPAPQKVMAWRSTLQA